MSLLCETKGFSIGTLQVPPFALKRGEWVSLSWPINYGSDTEKKFYSLLCGGTGPEFTPYSKVQVAAPLLSFDESWGKSSWNIGQLLGSLPGAEREMLLIDIRDSGVSLESPVNHLPGTTLLLAGLMLASLDGGLIVFNTAGLDPMGVQKVYAFVIGKLKQGLGFLELEFPGVRQQFPHPIPVVALEATLRYEPRKPV